MRIRVLCCFLLSQFFCRHVDAGRKVSLNTTSDHAQYFINDLGVNVKAGTLIFDLTSTQDAIIKLAQKQSLSGSTCDIIIGSVSNTAIAVRESCSGCNSLIMASGTFLDTVTPSAFWLDWTGSTTLLAGEGSVPGESILFTYSWQEPFEVNYLTATSYYGNEGQWNFVIDTPPSFISPAPDGSTAVSVPEDQPVNSTVIVISAQDEEADVVTFYLTGQHSDTFLVNGSDVILKEKLDFETKQGFQVILVATDGRHNTTVTFTVLVTDVIDESPVVTSGAVTSVPEELAVGTPVAGLFAVEDRDQGDSLTYTLRGNHSSYFSINRTSGEITVARRLDRDSGLSRFDDLWVKVTDSAKHVAELSLDLTVDDVNDNKPRFESDVYTVNITGSTAPGTPLLTFNVSDADQGNNGDVNLTLLTPRDGFWLTGKKLYVNISQLELGVKSVHTLLVEASDAATEMARLTTVAVVSVQVLPSNEHAPMWLHPVPGTSGWFPELSISEDAAVGALLLSLSARDDDIGPFGDVTYAMTSALTENGSNASHTFFLDPTSGDVTTTSVLDRDLATGGTSFYVLTFQAHDTGSRSSEAKLKVTVTDVNDNVPFFSQSVYSVHLSCDTAMGSTLTRVTAKDNDVTSTLTFTLVDGEGSEHFKVNEVTGDVTLESNVTAAAVGSNPRVLTVSVSDGGIPEMTSSAVIVVQMDGCSVGSSSAGENGTVSTDVSDVRLTNKILTVACGVLGAGFLLSVILLCVAKANQITPVKPANLGAVTTIEANMWSKPRSLTSIPPSNSTTARDSSVASELTLSSSLQSLQLV